MLKKLAGDTMLYGMGTIVPRLINWLLVIVHTRAFVEPEMLADNSQLYTYVVTLNIIYTFGMETTFFRYGSKKENQQEAFNQILSFVLVLGAVLSGLFIIFATPIIEAIGFPGKERLVIWLSIIMFIDTLCAIAFVKLRANNRAKKFVIARILNISINIGLNLFLIIFCKNIVEGKSLPDWLGFASFFYNPAVGPDYIIWANYVASLVTLLLLWREFVGFKFDLNLEKIKPIVKYAFPLMLMGLAGAINLTADRLMFRSLLPEGFYPDFPRSDQAFSIYAQVYKLSIFMTLVVQAYRYAADPLFFAKMGDKSSPGLIALSTKWFTIACMAIWLGVSLNLGWIQNLIGENYRSAVYIVPVLLLANLFVGVFGNISIWYKLSDKTQFGTYFTVGGMIITVVLNILLIPVLGYLGSSITFAVSTFGMLVASYYYGQKYFPVPYDLKYLMLYFVVATGLIVAFGYVIKPLGIPGILVNNFLIISFLIGIYYLEFKVRKDGGLRMPVVKYDNILESDD